jgi:hypothetical protein
MAIKFLQKELTGRIVIYRHHGYYRLTSEVVAGVTSLDLDQGMDEFLPMTVSDAELGAAVRRCHDATRFMSFKDLPKGEAAKAANKVWRAKFKLWEKRALQLTGKKTLRELYEGASRAASTRTDKVYAFFNSDQESATVFTGIPDLWPDYREFILPQPVDDATLGQTARAALDAVVRGAAPPADW